MKQSHLMSLIDSIGGTAVGFALAIIAQAIFWPMLGVEISPMQNFVSVGIMTVLSVARSYTWRRVMEAVHARDPISPGARAVLAERRRQTDVEGWSNEHDDVVHRDGELARAGASYALWHGAFVPRDWVNEEIWPWRAEEFKPVGFRRDMVKAGALILAEIDRWDRVGKRKSAVSVAHTSNVHPLSSAKK